MKKKFIKTPLKGVYVHGAKDVGTRTVNLLMGEHAGEYVRGDIMDANAVIQAFDELKGNVDSEHDSLEEVVDELHNLRDATDQSFEVFQEKAEEETANRIQGDKTLDEKIDQKERESKERDNVLQQNIDTEKQERVNADTQLRNDLTAEVNRAKARENALDSDIQAEATKRENDDNTIKDNLNAEVTRATAKENEIKAEVDIINGDSTTEGSFRKAIADVVGAAPEAYDTLKEIADKLNENDDLHAAINDAIATKATTVALNEEITRAKAAEAENKAEIAAEAARAKKIEGDNALAIQNEVSRATNAEEAINEAVNTEVERAKGQEAYLQNLVNTKADTTALEGAKTELDKKISDETTRATQSEIAISHNVDALSDEINKCVRVNEFNQKVDSLNADINAKQNAGNYIPYDPSVAHSYQIDKTLAVKLNDENSVVLGPIPCITLKSGDQNTLAVNYSAISLKSGDYTFDVNPGGIKQVAGDYKFTIDGDDGVRWSTGDMYAYMNIGGFNASRGDGTYARCSADSFIDIKRDSSHYVLLNSDILNFVSGYASCEIYPHEGMQILSGTRDDSNGLKLGYNGLRIGKKSDIDTDNGELISISVPYGNNTSAFKVSPHDGIKLSIADSQVTLNTNGVYLPNGDTNHVLTSAATTIDINNYVQKSVYDEKIAALEARIAALEAKHPEVTE